MYLCSKFRTFLSKYYSTHRICFEYNILALLQFSGRYKGLFLSTHLKVSYSLKWVKLHWFKNKISYIKNQAIDEERSCTDHIFKYFTEGKKNVKPCSMHVSGKSKEEKNKRSALSYRFGFVKGNRTTATMFTSCRVN